MIGSQAATLCTFPPLKEGALAIRSILPIEVLDQICRILWPKELAPLLRVNRVFYAISSRIFYHTIVGLRPKQLIACLQTLSRNHTLHPLVRSLEISLQALSPTANFYRLLHRVLKRLTSLSSLVLDLPRQSSAEWILNNCEFSLKQFTTTFCCQHPLAHFLDKQPSITDLTLRGFQSDDTSAITPFFHPTFNLSHDSTFNLLPTSLPKLSHFRAIHAGPSVIASVLSNRPLEVVSISLFPSCPTETLDALELSSTPLKRLSIMSFDPNAPVFLLRQIGRRLPQLEALHVVIMLAEYTTELLEAAGPMLSEFTSLQYLTFMAATGDGASYADEKAIAKLWHKSCPTLKTIILPRGRVWFEAKAGWGCLDD